MTRMRSVRSVYQKCCALLGGAAAKPFVRGSQDSLNCHEVTFHYLAPITASSLSAIPLRRAKNIC